MLKKTKVDFKVIASSVAHGAREQSFSRKRADKRSEKIIQATNLQKSEDEEQSDALAILDGTAKLENSRIGDIGSSCNITNQSTSMYDVESINEHVKGSCGGMKTTKKGEL